VAHLAMHPQIAYSGEEGLQREGVTMSRLRRVIEFLARTEIVIALTTILVALVVWLIMA
jgi:hypothetical protein